MKQSIPQIKLEQLTEDMIRFLQKWGLWRDVGILTMGNGYFYSEDDEKSFRGLKHVEVVMGVDPERRMEGLTGWECDGTAVWKSLANPEHIFDMTFEGALHTLLNYDSYETRKSDIGGEGWEELFEKTDILEEFLYEKYDCADVSEFRQQLYEEKFENPDYSEWDPLVFDTWKEYQEFIGYEEPGLSENYKRFDTYEKYLEEKRLADSNAMEEIEPIWEQMVADAKLAFMRDCGADGQKIIALNELYGGIKEEFDALFEGYGLWYDQCFSWSLTCYRLEAE